MGKITLIAASILTSVVMVHAQQTGDSYLDRNLPAEIRAEDLVGRLTIEEKTSLMMFRAAEIRRLGIKQYNWWNEALHGVARNGSATVFPQPIAMAASFDENLLFEVFTAVSDEARVKFRTADNEGKIDQYEGITFWTPNINIFRDPRWGRGMETYGEDPYLTSVMGCAVVRGLQGSNETEIEKAHACAKHFAVHSGPESSRHSYNAVISERDLRETYLPAFKALVTKAGVKEVMTAYNRFEGVPCGASSRLIKDILRGEWGFKGLVVSDCWAVDDFFHKDRHNFVESPAAAVATAIKNGMDVECGEAFKHIPEAIEQGLLTEEDLDKCLVRQIAERFRLGEMDGVSLWDGLPDDIVEGEEHRALSLMMARESIVLLQNRDDVLPLSKGEKVAVIGPNADDAKMMWGNYNPIPHSTVTLLQAMKNRLGDNVTFFKACGIVDSKYALESTKGVDFSSFAEDQYEEIARKYAISVNDVRNLVNQTRRMKDNFYPELDVKSVLKQLEGMETVIFAGGISPHLEGEEMPVSFPGFMGGDRTDIELPGVQRKLLKALHEAGKKVIFVNFSGSAMALGSETESCDAILQAWYPGQEGGTAIADIIYGDVNPSGKLPVTFYKDNSQLPDFENYDMEGRTYRYLREEPLFPFGFGMSYTTFRYSKAKIKDDALTFKLSNIGKKDGTETVQLYISRPDDPKGPEKALRAFRRVEIPAGKTVEVKIPLTEENFEWWDPQVQNMAVLHGDYVLHYGSSSSSRDLQTVDFKF